MKIVAISDLHGYLPKQLPEGDVLVIAGDVCPDLRPITQQIEWGNQVLVPWLRKMSEQFRNTIVVLGNHDFVEWEGNYGIYQWHDALNDFEDGPPSSFVYFVERPQTIELGSKIFYCNPYCLRLPGWAYQTTEEELAEMYRKIPLGVDVIVSHGPPLDYCDKLDKIPGFHAGSKSLKEAIRKARPKAVITGHIHESFGTYTLHHHGQSETTTIYNVSQLDINYKYHNRPVIIEV
jgi:Icc-related predicted phosphoesterase